MVHMLCISVCIVGQPTHSPIRLGRQIAKAIFQPTTREILMCAVKRTYMKRDMLLPFVSSRSEKTSRAAGNSRRKQPQ